MTNELKMRRVSRKNDTYDIKRLMNKSVFTDNLYFICYIAAPGLVSLEMGFV